jgi:hypothetical protein
MNDLKTIANLNKLSKYCENYAEFANELLAKTAEKKKKKKLDPKAKVRNRGTVCVPASSAKDHKDHFPINDIDQARNALARAHQYSKAPSWYKGSLKGLQDLVSRKVHSKYPAIGKDKKKKSAVMELADRLIAKAQEIHPVAPEMEKTVQYLLALLANPSKALQEKNKPLVSRYFAFSEDAKNHQVATWLNREHDTLLYTLEDLKMGNATDPLKNVELVLQGLNVYKGVLNPEYHKKVEGILNYLHDQLMKMMPAKPEQVPAPAPKPMPGGTPMQTPKNMIEPGPTIFNV